VIFPDSSFVITAFPTTFESILLAIRESFALASSLDFFLASSQPFDLPTPTAQGRVAAFSQWSCMLFCFALSSDSVFKYNEDSAAFANAANAVEKKNILAILMVFLRIEKYSKQKSRCYSKFLEWGFIFVTAKWHWLLILLYYTLKYHRRFFMNKGFKPVLFTALVAVLGTANAQHAPTAPAAPSTPAPAVVTPAPATPAAPAAPSAPAPAVVAPAPAAPSAPAPAVIAPAPAPASAPAAHSAPAPAHEAPTQPEPAAQAPEAASETQVAAAKPDSAIILIVEHPKPKKKRGYRPNKSDLTLVDIPANFEIQARKIMPIEDKGNDKDPVNNLDTWWGRANLAVETRSDYFEGRIHLRMYPGQFYGDPIFVEKSSGLSTENRDILQVHEAWAWHRGDYVNLKLGRWDNTTRYGSKTFGGYLDSKKNRSRGTIDDPKFAPSKPVSEIKSGFMSTLDPENILQFGLNNFSENVSLDIALVSSDKNLNKGDLRVYFTFKGLEGLKPLNIGIGYRSNVFDEIWYSEGDVTHTVDVGASVNLLNDVGIIKNFNLFVEGALIGLDDQAGYDESKSRYRYRHDRGGIPKGYEAIAPLVGGLEFDLYQGFDKFVVEAEYNGDRVNTDTESSFYGDKKIKVRNIQGSIYVQKKLNDRFTLNMGMQSENNTKDFSFAGRLQGKIN
jgi:hypothetical protein